MIVAFVLHILENRCLFFWDLGDGRVGVRNVLQFFFYLGFEKMLVLENLSQVILRVVIKLK